MANYLVIDNGSLPAQSRFLNHRSERHFFPVIETVANLPWFETRTDAGGATDRCTQLLGAAFTEIDAAEFFLTFLLREMP